MFICIFLRRPVTLRKQLFWLSSNFAEETEVFPTECGAETDTGVYEVVLLPQLWVGITCRDWGVTPRFWLKWPRVRPKPICISGSGYNVYSRIKIHPEVSDCGTLRKKSTLGKESTTGSGTMERKKVQRPNDVQESCLGTGHWRASEAGNQRRQGDSLH